MSSANRYYDIAPFCHPFPDRDQALIYVSDDRRHNLNCGILALRLYLMELRARSGILLSPDENQCIPRTASSNESTGSSLQGHTKAWMTTVYERPTISQNCLGKSFDE